jgi:hypothetical protein
VLGSVASARAKKETAQVDRDLVFMENNTRSVSTTIIATTYESLSFFPRFSESKPILNSLNLEDQTGLARILLQINERKTESRNKAPNVHFNSILSEGQFVTQSAHCF